MLIFLDAGVSSKSLTEINVCNPVRPDEDFTYDTPLPTSSIEGKRPRD